MVGINAQSFDEQLEESLNIWGTIAYKGIIPPSAIIKEDYDYYS